MNEKEHITIIHGPNGYGKTVLLTLLNVLFAKHYSKLRQGMQYLFRSLDRGDTRERISPDLTYNTGTEMGDIPYHTIFSISESPLKFGLIYVGTDDRKVRITKDGGKTWNVLGGNPPSTYVHDLIIHPRDNIIVIATHGRGMWAMDANPTNEKDKKQPRRFF